MPALKCHILYTWNRTMTFTFSQRAVWITQSGCVRAVSSLYWKRSSAATLLEFFYKYLIRHEDGTFSQRYHQCSSLSVGEKKNLRVCACLNCKKVAITTLWPIGLLLYYNSTVSLRWPVLFWIIQVTVLTASLSSVYSIYILEKKSTCLSVKRKKGHFFHFHLFNWSITAKRNLTRVRAG